MGDALKLKVRAPADKGRANKSVEELIASKLGLAKGLVTIVRGQTSEQKVIEIHSMSNAELMQHFPFPD